MGFIQRRDANRLTSVSLRFDRQRSPLRWRRVLDPNTGAKGSRRIAKGQIAKRFLAPNQLVGYVDAVSGFCNTLNTTIASLYTGTFADIAGALL
jgi:hypothetical protein